MGFNLKMVFIVAVLIVCFISIRPAQGELKYPDPSAKCGSRYGCHKGYCWSNCKGLLQTPGATYGAEWCYTSKSDRSLSREYVTCKEDNECNACWKCGGECTL